MVSVDIYVNETTRHADVILPAPSPLQRSHYDVALLGFAVRNVANYSPPVLAPDPDMPAEWETLLRLTGVVTGQGPNADVAAIDRFVALETARRQTADAHSPVHGRDPEELLAEVAPRVGPERILDLLLRTGPYELTLADLEAAPHGIDLGPLEPRVPEVLRTASGKIELAPDAARRRRRAPARGAGRAGQRRHGPRRAPRPALEQLVDAQPADARQRQAALHRPRPPRRRRAPRAGRRRAGASCARAPAPSSCPSR